MAVQAGMLGRCRYFVKKELVYEMPLFGLAFWVSEIFSGRRMALLR